MEDRREAILISTPSLGHPYSPFCLQGSWTDPPSPIVAPIKGCGVKIEIYDIKKNPKNPVGWQHTRVNTTKQTKPRPVASAAPHPITRVGRGGRGGTENMFFGGGRPILGINHTKKQNKKNSQNKNKKIHKAKKRTNNPLTWLETTPLTTLPLCSPTRKRILSLSPNGLNLTASLGGWLYDIIKWGGGESKFGKFMKQRFLNDNTWLRTTNI